MTEKTARRIFDMVAAKRVQGRIFSSFKPLEPCKVTELRALLKQGLQGAENDKLRGAFLTASEMMDKYDAMPKTVQTAIVDPASAMAAIYAGAVVQPRILGYKNVVNTEAVALLQDMERKLYKALKKSAL